MTPLTNDTAEPGRVEHEAGRLDGELAQVVALVAHGDAALADRARDAADALIR